VVEYRIGIDTTDRIAVEEPRIRFRPFRQIHYSHSHGELHLIRSGANHHRALTSSYTGHHMLLQLVNLTFRAASAALYRRRA
ncbi:hypothetical protein, partial [Sporosarcina sp. NCCP-2222]|uniref:hypothetical protein n=1 Tax=Sporosarcina sp. NCCP-2222 TaxID=2935073 RepID=UPI0020C0D29C